MEKFKITPSNEEECEKIYEKALELGYNYYNDKKPLNTVDIIFFYEDGDITVQTGDPVNDVHPALLEVYLTYIESYPEITGEKFLKK